MVQQRLDMRPNIRQRLDELDALRRDLIIEKERIEDEILALVRDIQTLNDALAVEQRFLGEPVGEQGAVMNGQLAGMGLREVVAALRREIPTITKPEVRQRLDEAHFDFRGKQPGNAINMAWINLDAQERRNDGNG